MRTVIRNPELLAGRNAEILRLYNEGLSYAEIAQQIGLKTPSYVQKYCTAQGLKPNLTKKQQAVKELRLQGLCGSEITERLGIDRDSVSAIARRVGLPFTEEEKARSQRLGHKKRTHSDKTAAELVQKRTPEFEYVGGYTGSEGTLTIRCKKCGAEMLRSIISIRHKNVKCEACAKAELEERRRLREEERQAEIFKRREEKKAERERALWSKPTVQVEFRVCSICGGVFLSNSPRQITCGGDCAKKLQAHKDKRIKRMKALTKDKDITLESLFRRDNGVCYLCGVECDWSDIEETERGKIAGDWYPSIDHVRPIAKGGLHSWDNVRLAHRICNYLKSDAWTAPKKIS